MTDAAAFIATICAEPDNIAARLVYADWLEERGDCERAEFIKVQVELGNVVEPHVCGFDHGARACWVCRLRRRADALLAANLPIWLDELPDGIRCGGIEKRPTTSPLVFFRRGMVEAVECSLESFAGETCKRCGGTGTWRRLFRDRVPVVPSVTEKCIDCHGTGRTPGLGALLAQRTPLREVRTKMKPWAEPGTDSPNWFAWFSQSQHDILHGDNMIPSDLYAELLKNAPDKRAAGGGAIHYPSADAANAALSAALLRLAREQAKAMPKEVVA